MSEEADDAGEAAEADAKGRSTVPWMPTCTAATEFFRVRTEEHPEGFVYGADDASTVSGDHDGAKIFGVGCWVRAADGPSPNLPLKKSQSALRPPHFT